MRYVVSEITQTCSCRNFTVAAPDDSPWGSLRRANLSTLASWLVNGGAPTLQDYVRALTHQYWPISSPIAIMAHNQPTPIAIPALAIGLYCEPKGLANSFNWSVLDRKSTRLQSLMRISYAVFCLKKKKQNE